LSRPVLPEPAQHQSPYLPSWSISGTYFESCNCEAVCPCRKVGDVPGGRSTYGVCLGALSWRIEDGGVGEIPLAGLAAVLVLQYDDDEPGSPWRFVLHVDERGDERQRQALADIFLGRLGGEGITALPWVRKFSELLELRTSRIEIEHERSGHVLRVGGALSMRASQPVETQERVSCVIPGHHIAGEELYTDEFRVEDEPFEWELTGNCAFVSKFAYSSG
jgi:hypothetical protein